MASIPGRSARVRLLLLALAVLLHLYGLYRSTGPATPSWFPYADKLWHLLGFGAPVFLILLTWSRPPVGSVLAPPATIPALVVGIFALHAVVSELIQHFFYANRAGDPLDSVADGVGVAVGWGAARLVGANRSGAIGDRPRRPGDSGNEEPSVPR